MMRQHAITEKSESSLDDDFGKWSPLFQNSSVGVAVANSAFRFITGNVAFLKMLNCSREELQLSSLLDIFVEENRDEYEVPLRELREGARLQYEVETRYLRKDGTSLPVHACVSTVNATMPTQLTFLIIA